MTEYPHAALAVEHGGLSIDQQGRLYAVLAKHSPGMQVADYLDALYQHDEYLEVTEPWWQRFGGQVTESVALAVGVPEVFAQRLVAMSLLALVAVPDRYAPHPMPVVRDVVRVAERAALWSKGHAYARG